MNIDHTTVLMLDLLKRTLADEPERVDLDKHDGHHLHEVASVHYQWERQVGALRLLIGVRLTNLALEGDDG